MHGGWGTCPGSVFKACHLGCRAWSWYGTRACSVSETSVCLHLLYYYYYLLLKQGFSIWEALFSTLLAQLKFFFYNFYILLDIYCFYLFIDKKLTMAQQRLQDHAVALGIDSSTVVRYDFSCFSYTSWMNVYACYMYRWSSQQQKPICLIILFF